MLSPVFNKNEYGGFIHVCSFKNFGKNDRSDLLNQEYKMSEVKNPGYSILRELMEKQDYR